MFVTVRSKKKSGNNLVNFSDKKAIQVVISLVNQLVYHFYYYFHFIYLFILILDKSPVHSEKKKYRHSQLVRV